jgi:tol-pal system protein YbgF
MMKKLIWASFLLMTQLFPLSGNAALFDDTEARKKIIEVEAAVSTNQQATQGALTDIRKKQVEVEQRLLSIEAITKGQVLTDMLNQIEMLKQEIALLKGGLEMAAHNVDETQQRQQDLYADTDTRLRVLEGNPSAATESLSSNGETAAPVLATTAAPNKNTQEYQMLELAYGLSKESKYKAAYDAYDKFLKDYPNSAWGAEAKYGLGYSQFALKNYKSAIVTQQKLLDQHPNSNKVPEAMFNMANSQIQLGLLADAKKSLRDLIAKFPNSEVIAAAQKRLKALESIR